MNTYADDLAALVKALELTSVVHVGHSTGGGEVVRYIARHGSKHVAKAVLISAVPPLMLKTPTTLRAPDGGLRRKPRRRAGGPLTILQGSERAVLRRQQTWLQSLAGSSGSFWMQGMEAG